MQIRNEDLRSTSHLLGRVAVTAEEAETHNRLLSEAEVVGLDRCEVGQGRWFYVRRGAKGKPVVTTWNGDLVADRVHEEGGVPCFTRNGRTFRDVAPRGDGTDVHFDRILSRAPARQNRFQREASRASRDADPVSLVEGTTGSHPHSPHVEGTRGE